MAARVKLFLVVGLLVLVGGSAAAYKSLVLRIPFFTGEQVSEWVIEARVSFLATGRPVKAVLALPQGGQVESASQGASSLGYGFHVTAENARREAVWSAGGMPAREGGQALYYRIRLSLGGPSGAGAVAGEPEPEGLEPTELAGIELAAAKELIGRARARSADASTLVTELLLMLAGDSQEVSMLRRQDVLQDSSAVVPVGVALELLQAAGVPARLAHGVRLEERRGRQPMLPLIEYFTGQEWKVVDPQDPGRTLEGRVFVWHRGPGPLVEVYGGENSEVGFTVLRDRVPIEQFTALRESPMMISTILALPAADRAVFRYVVLIPLGAFVVVVLRNLVGIPTLGTFMPVLIALALLEIELVPGLLMFSVIVAAGLYFRFLLSRLNLLVVPRVAACVVIVSLLMMLMSVVSYHYGFGSGMRSTVFPMIILAWTIERMSLIWEEEGKRNALIQVGGSLLVAVLAYLFMQIRQMQYWAFYFPELLLILLAAIILIGRFTGYRLSELVRFRNFQEIQ
jgi:hypothetical protein